MCLMARRIFLFSSSSFSHSFWDFTYMVSLFKSVQWTGRMWTSSAFKFLIIILEIPLMYPSFPTDSKSVKYTSGTWFLFLNIELFVDIWDNISLIQMDCHVMSCHCWRIIFRTRFFHIFLQQKILENEISEWLLRTFFLSSSTTDISVYFVCSLTQSTSKYIVKRIRQKNQFILGTSRFYIFEITYCFENENDVVVYKIFFEDILKFFNFPKQVKSLSLQKLPSITPVRTCGSWSIRMDFHSYLLKWRNRKQVSSESQDGTKLSEAA